MPRFAILEHDHPMLHWDLMLEAGEVLWTWRLTAPPRAGVAGEATRIADHRPLYLDYEGPVPGNRGRVLGWDRGAFAWEGQDEGKIVVRLEGERLRGTLRLEQITEEAWRALFEVS